MPPPPSSAIVAAHLPLMLTSSNSNKLTASAATLASRERSTSDPTTTNSFFTLHSMLSTSSSSSFSHHSAAATTSAAAAGAGGSSGTPSSSNNNNNNNVIRDWNIHQSVASGNVGLVKLALDKSPSVVNSILNGMHPIHVAAGCGDLPILRLLLSRGADINARRLSRAANASLENLVSYNLISPTSANLVKMNVDLGATPLHFAVANDKFDVADYLVNSGGGARVLLMDEFNCTPLDLAIAKQSHDMINLLVKRIQETHPDALSQFLSTSPNNNNSFSASSSASSSPGDKSTSPLLHSNNSVRSLSSSPRGSNLVSPTSPLVPVMGLSRSYTTNTSSSTSSKGSSGNNNKSYRHRANTSIGAHLLPVLTSGGVGGLSSPLSPSTSTTTSSNIAATTTSLIGTLLLGRSSSKRHPSTSSSTTSSGSNNNNTEHAAMGGMVGANTAGTNVQVSRKDTLHNKDKLEEWDFLLNPGAFM